MKTTNQDLFDINTVLVLLLTLLTCHTEMAIHVNIVVEWVLSYDHNHDNYEVNISCLCQFGRSKPHQDSPSSMTGCVALRLQAGNDKVINFSVYHFICPQLALQTAIYELR